MRRRTQAGQYRHRARIERLQETENDHGEREENYDVFAVVWCKLDQNKPQSGGFSSFADQADIKHELTIRYHSALDGLRSDDRLVLLAKTERIFEINAVANIDYDNCEMILICTERFSDNNG